MLDGVELAVTLSAGIAGSNGSTVLELTSLLNDADVALYTAKSLGRDQIYTYRIVDENAEVPRASIDLAARSQAAQLGRVAFDAANERLLHALAERPGWAGGPSQLIARIASELARAVGLPDTDVERIRAASLLHDLGKLAIPDEILSKPGELTPAEWRTITEHPKIGQVVLEQAGAIRDAAEIVLHHHEWFDGRGYPHGLKETEIPLGSRIVAIADAYEAMISGRPYKPSMTHAEAIAELRRAAGVQFDPDIVQLFVTLYGRNVPSTRSLAASSRRR
jgi:putative nucleotidyltransferase with HDIG domain